METKKILITGASRGIGKAIAQTLAQSGRYRLILHASSLENLKWVEQEIASKREIHLLPCNFLDQVETKAFLGTLRSDHKDLYGVISNAGITRDKALMYQPLAEIDELIQVNLKVPIQLAKFSSKLFIRNKRGVFIGITSCVGESGNAFQAVYAATKAGITAMCKSLAKEVADISQAQGIRFLTCAPGFIDTEMTKDLPQEIQERYLSMIPSGRFGKPEDVANTIAHLLCPEAEYINGVEIKVNGGLL
jgi:3-oxoacyl-[acyl-carrier protein] reductase